MAYGETTWVWNLERNDHVVINGRLQRVDAVERGPKPKDLVRITLTGGETVTFSGMDQLPINRSIRNMFD